MTRPTTILPETVLPVTILFGLGLTALAAAQTTPGAQESYVTQAYTNLRGDSLSLVLDATETYLGQPVNTHSTVQWIGASENGRDVLRIEVTVSRDGTLVQRVVADGHTVWNYDARRNVYSALPVDRLTGAQANTYRPSIENAVTDAVSGPTADLVRLAREVMGANGFRSWLPGVTPVAGKRLGEEYWAIYDLPTGNAKRVTFEIADDEGEARFTRFRRWGSTRVGREWRTLDEVIETDATPVEATSPAFVFVAPRTAVSVPARAIRF